MYVDSVSNHYLEIKEKILLLVYNIYIFCTVSTVFHLYLYCAMLRTLTWNNNNNHREK